MVPNFHIENKGWNRLQMNHVNVHIWFIKKKLLQLAAFSWRVISLHRREVKPRVHGGRISVTASLALMKLRFLIPTYRFSCCNYFYLICLWSDVNMHLIKWAHNYLQKYQLTRGACSQPCAFLVLVSGFLMQSHFEDCFMKCKVGPSEGKSEKYKLFFFFFLKLGCSLSVYHTVPNRYFQLFWISYSRLGK